MTLPSRSARSAAVPPARTLEMSSSTIKQISCPGLVQGRAYSAGSRRFGAKPRRHFHKIALGRREGLVSARSQAGRRIRCIAIFGDVGAGVGEFLKIEQAVGALTQLDPSLAV